MHLWTLAATALAVLALGAAATLTSDQQSAIGKQLSYYESLIMSSSADMGAYLKAGASATSTPSCSRHPACGANAASLAGYSINFSLPVQTSFDYVQTKEYTTPTSSATERELCSAVSMLSTWQWARSKAANGTVFFQYYAGQSNNFAVYPPMTWNCAATYTPTQRPYYVSGSAGQKDVVILIDVSTSSATATGVDPASRVAMSVAAAVQLIQSLSFRDYVGVITYGDVANSALTPTLLQATIANVALLVASVQRITVATGNGAAVAGALRAAVSLLQASVAIGATSGCNQAIVLLSGGFDDTSTDDPVNVVASYSAATYFAVYIAPTATTSVPPTTMLLRISCAGNGVSTTAAGTSAAAQAAAGIVTTYFSNVVTLTNARWSEYYTDAFGQGTITSGAFPVYTSGSLQGVVAMDVPLSALTLNGAATYDDVNSLLLSSGQCVTVQPSDPTTAAAIATQQNGQCTGVDLTAASTPDLTDRRLKPLWVIITVVIALFFTFIPCTMLDDDPFIGLPSIVCGGICWIIALSVFWVYVFDDAVIKSNFDTVTYVAIRDDPNAYRCCQRRYCQCSTAPYSAPSCPALLSTLTEGTCGGGYKCCNTVCYSCNCYTTSYKCGKSTCSSTHCSTCCYCARSVSNQQCQVVCGTCYSPVITVAYQYKGASYNAKVIGSCGLNDTACPTNWFAQAPLQKSGTGYVNPNRPTEFLLSESLNVAAVVATGIFAFIAVLVGGHALVWFLRTRWCRRDERAVDPPMPADQEMAASANADVQESKEDLFDDKSDDDNNNDSCVAVPVGHDPVLPAEPFQSGQAPPPPQADASNVAPLGKPSMAAPVAHYPEGPGAAPPPTLYPSYSLAADDVQPL